ncbi:hypothetical protein ACFX15_035380 [Malus domestica]
MSMLMRSREGLRALMAVSRHERLKECDWCEQHQCGGDYGRKGGSYNISGSGASPWDPISSSPVQICPSGDAVKSSSSKHGVGSLRITLHSENAQSFEDGEGDMADLDEGQKYEISESMCLEMEYNSDRACYDREEGNTMFDTVDSSSLFFGDDASFQKKEAELEKRLVRRDGTKMTLAQSKKLSQLTANTAQWEDRQLWRSGAVRGVKVQTGFNDEEEHKVLLLVHDTNLKHLFLDDSVFVKDGSVVFTKRAEQIMPIKDTTSGMAIISRNVKIFSTLSPSLCFMWDNWFQQHPSSALYGMGCNPDYVIYHELVLTMKEYMQCATAVEPQWLAEFGPMFCHVKESDNSMLEHKKRQKGDKTVMEADIENLRKARAEAEKESKQKEREKRSKQQQQVGMLGLHQGSSTYLRPKKLGL